MIRHGGVTEQNGWSVQETDYLQKILVYSTPKAVRSERIHDNLDLRASCHIMMYFKLWKSFNCDLIQKYLRCSIQYIHRYNFMENYTTQLSSLLVLSRWWVCTHNTHQETRREQVQDHLARLCPIGGPSCCEIHFKWNKAKASIVYRNYRWTAYSSIEKMVTQKALRQAH